MSEILRDYIGRIRIGDRQVYKNMAMFPITSDEVIPFDYLILDEAMAEDLIEVVEIDDEGSVPELKVINKSEKMILILDGEELVGSKQNRIVNTTLLIPGNETVVIPVSCVEQGRWAYTSEYFLSEKRLAPYTLRAMKAGQVLNSVRESGRFTSDQGAIWSELSLKAGRRGVVSDSMAMSEIYKNDRSSLEQYLDKFTLMDSQIGAIFVINGKVVGMDCLGKPETFEKMFKKLVESYALDAIDSPDAKGGPEFSKEHISDFIESAGRSRAEENRAVGLGTDLRLVSEKCTGFALLHEQGILHLSVFARDEQGVGPKPSSKMSRFSFRRLLRRG